MQSCHQRFPLPGPDGRPQSMGHRLAVNLAGRGIQHRRRLALHQDALPPLELALEGEIQDLIHRIHEAQCNLLLDAGWDLHRSFSLSRGSSTVWQPMRCPAKTFSLTPPMGRIFPRKVISPVMATERWTGILVKTLMTAVARVIPAEGPSLGM